jgi:hypothetical protein
MRVFIRDQFMQRSYEIFQLREIEGHGTYVRQPDGSEVFVPIGVWPVQDVKPTFTIDYHSAQELVEALQKTGVKPKELTKIEGQFAAQSAHLADLQNIIRTRGIMK